MNLRWKAFEKSLQARVKSYDARRKMTFWQWHGRYISVSSASGPRVPEWILPVIRAAPGLALMVFALSWGIASPFWAAPEELIEFGSSIAGYIVLWSFFVTIIRVGIVRIVVGSRSETVLSMLPLTSDRIFDRMMRWIVFDLVCLVFEFACAYGSVAFAYRQPLSSFAICALCSILQAALSLAVTLLLLRRKAKMDTPFILLCIFGLMPLGVWQEFLGRSATHILLSFCNPLGWINTVYLDGWIRGDQRAYWCLLPVLAVVATLPASLRAFRRMHHRGAFPVVRVIGGRIVVEPARATSPPESDPATLRRQILAADFLQPMPWNERGLLERLLSFVLRPGEIVIARSLLISPPAWIKRLLVFVVGFLCIWSIYHFLDFHSFQKLVVRSKLPRLAIEAAMMLAEVIILFVIGFAIALFSWMPNPFKLSLLPLWGFEVWKVAAKINALVLAVLLLLALLFSSPPHFATRGDSGTGVNPLARIIFMIGCIALTGIWSVAIHRLGALRPWTSRIVVFLGLLAPPCAGLVCMSCRSPVFALAPLFIMAPVGWSYLCRTLELKAWRIAASKSAASFSPRS
jgi:hypothetical protein